MFLFDSFIHPLSSLSVCARGILCVRTYVIFPHHASSARFRFAQTYSQSQPDSQYSPNHTAQHTSSYYTIIANLNIENIWTMSSCQVSLRFPLPTTTHIELPRSLDDIYTPDVVRDRRESGSLITRFLSFRLSMMGHLISRRR